MPIDIILEMSYRFCGCRYEGCASIRYGIFFMWANVNADFLYNLIKIYAQKLGGI